MGSMAKELRTVQQTGGAPLQAMLDGPGGFTVRIFYRIKQYWWA